MSGNPFWNSSEHRVRAAWRLLLQLLLLLPLTVGVAYVVQPVTGSIATSILAYLFAVVLSIWLAARFLDRRPFPDFGFRLSKQWWADLGFGFILGIVLMGAIFLTERAFGWLTITGTFEDVSEPAGFATMLAGTLLIYACVGFYEELLSRGYQTKNLAESLHGRRIDAKKAIWLAVILSSAVFGLAHALNPNASAFSTFNIVLAGLFLGLGYILTGELALSIGLHTSWNFAMGALFGFPVSGTSQYSLANVFVIEQSGPVLFTGGEFGPEAGLLGLAAMAVGSIGIVAWVRLRYGRASVHTAIADPPGSTIPKHVRAGDTPARTRKSNRRKGLREQPRPEGP
jgi:uncharacterized protein